MEATQLTRIWKDGKTIEILLPGERPLVRELVNLTCPKCSTKLITNVGQLTKITPEIRGMAMECHNCRAHIFATNLDRTHIITEAPALADSWPADSPQPTP